MADTAKPVDPAARAIAAGPVAEHLCSLNRRRCWVPVFLVVGRSSEFFVCQDEENKKREIVSPASFLVSLHRGKPVQGGDPAEALAFFRNNGS